MFEQPEHAFHEGCRRRLDCSRGRFSFLAVIVLGPSFVCTKSVFLCKTRSKPLGIPFPLLLGCPGFHWGDCGSSVGSSVPLGLLPDPLGGCPGGMPLVCFELSHTALRPFDPIPGYRHEALCFFASPPTLRRPLSDLSLGAPLPFICTHSQSQ